MAVVIETTLGDITVDLFVEQRPITCLNFLKLCKMKYYNYNLFHSIRSGFIAQTGDPTGEGSGGESIWGVLEGPQKRYFSGEKMPKIRHTDAGLLSMVCSDEMMVGSQFFFTLAPDLDSLDGTHCVIGEVTEGQEVLSKLNEVICDDTYRPYRDVRITHTVVLEDPFSDPAGLRAPSCSPSPSVERLKGGRIAPDEEIDETQGKSAAEIQELIEEKEAKARATILEIVGDLPDADIAPPENVLFVCKLNPVTTDDDLEIIFCRFGKIVSCEVIRDKTSGNSLQYAFIEFEDKKSCEDAYFKMDNVLIDDRRIHVDFAQSVSKMRWLGKGRGVQYLDDKNSNKNNDRRDKEYEKTRFEGRDKTREGYYDNRKREKQDDRNDKVRDKTYNNRSSKYEMEKNRSRSRNHSEDRMKNGDNKKHSESYRTNKSDHRNNHTSRSHRASRSPVRNDKQESSTKNYRKERGDDIDKRNKDYKSKERDDRNNYDRLKSDEKLDKKKNHHNTESKTPSPIDNKKMSEIKKKSNLKKAKKEKSVKKTTKRKRKESSSSSDSDSSNSSSSSSSSSSESDQKKKKNKRKKRKVSTSSSSSDSSDSSTSSSSSSSDTSSTSSDSEPKKKRSKKSNKKVKKSRNK